MNKELIEKIALEVAQNIQVPLMPEGNTYFVPDDLAIEFATRFLSRIDAERGKSAAAFFGNCDQEGHLCLQRTTSGLAIDSIQPLFLSPTPTIPEGKQ